MTKPPTSNLPIGYWLKQADKLITEHINRVQAANGVSRFEWQVLNLLHEAGATSRESLFETMRTFVDASSLHTILNRLIENGWVKQGDGAQGVANFQLTDDGRRHHGVILAAQKQAREKMMQGISEEDYATVIRVLQRLVGNLKQGETRPDGIRNRSA